MNHSNKQNLCLNDKNNLEKTMDLEELNKRQSALNVLESWDKQAMHAISSNISIGQVRKRMEKTLAGINSVKKEF
ncbi:hypothetical protein PCK1_002864 [Pneumocystis canis]|nr:hypothetical protein PCK1_002864 [Pneumocystis canis]